MRDKTDYPPSLPSSLFEFLVMEQSLVQYKESEENEIRNEVDADDLLFVKLPKELENESDNSNCKNVSTLHIRES